MVAKFKFRAKKQGRTGLNSPETLKGKLVEIRKRNEQLLPDLQGLCFTEVQNHIIMPSCKQSQACDTLKDELLLSTEVEESGT